MSSNKIFIIGLPRTATTSVCVALLEAGFKTAHTAYTQKAFANAQVIADTPVFAEFEKLDQTYANSKFIYLERDLESWLPSIRQLLQRMLVNLTRTDGGFNPHIKSAFLSIFPSITQQKIDSDDYLRECYLDHNKRVISHFADRADDLLTIKVSDSKSFNLLADFLELDKDNLNAHQGFKPINMKGKVTAWNDIRHPLKVDSTNSGRIDKILF